MARATPLQELSIVRVAKDLGVTPALIHYYLDGRDALTSGVMNAFYKEMQLDWPLLTSHWREDVGHVVRGNRAKDPGDWKKQESDTGDSGVGEEVD